MKIRIRAAVAMLVLGAGLVASMPAVAQGSAPGPVITREELARQVPPLAEPGADQPLELKIDGVPEVAGPQPATDPELSPGLPPLEQFDVREIELAQPSSEPADTNLRYAIRVDGLEALAAPSEARLRREFDWLSALREGKGNVANEAMLLARLSDDAELLRAILESQGWYSAEISTRLDRGTPGQPVTVVIQVAPGARYRFGSIRITADPTVPAKLIRENLPLTVGEPIVAAQVQAAEARVAVALPEHGYPFATVGQRDVLLDQETHLGDYSLPVKTGPRARFGGFRTTGKLAFGPDHIATVARFRRGEIYDGRMVDDLRQALIATGLFDTISVEPERTGLGAGDGTEYVTMLVRQDAGPPRTLAATAGYETGQGVRAQASWTHRNLFRPEGALTASLTAGTKELAAGLQFRRSNAGKRDRTFQLGFDAERNRYDAFDALTGRLGARLSYDSTPIWRKPLTWAVGAEVVGTAEKAWDFATNQDRRRKFLIGGINGQIGVDRTDSLLDPTRGFRAQALVQPEASLSNSFSPYVRGQLDGSAYLPLSGFVLAGRVRVASTLGIERNDLAPSRRFYGGGGGSVRGFGYQQLGPRDPLGDPAGGLSLIEGSAEVRYRFGDYGVVGFVDAGQAYVDPLPRFSDVRVGIGLGARYYTNFGPLRIDIATPLARRKGESRINVYISIGQAF